MMLFGGGFAVLFHIDCAAVFYVMWCGYPHNRAQLSTLLGRLYTSRMSKLVVERVGCGKLYAHFAPENKACSATVRT